MVIVFYPHSVYEWIETFKIGWTSIKHEVHDVVRTASEITFNTSLLFLGAIMKWSIHVQTVLQKKKKKDKAIKITPAPRTPHNTSAADPAQADSVTITRKKQFPHCRQFLTLRRTSAMYRSLLGYIIISRETNTMELKQVAHDLLVFIKTFQ